MTALEWETPKEVSPEIKLVKDLSRKDMERIASITGGLFDFPETPVAYPSDLGSVIFAAGGNIHRPSLDLEREEDGSQILRMHMKGLSVEYSESVKVTFGKDSITIHNGSPKTDGFSSTLVIKRRKIEYERSVPFRPDFSPKGW